MAEMVVKTSLGGAITTISADEKRRGEGAGEQAA